MHARSPSRRRAHRVLLPAVALLVIGLPALVPAGRVTAAAAPVPPPNVIFILTDDQPVGMLRTPIPNPRKLQRRDPNRDISMEYVVGLLAKPGLEFSRAYVVNSLCCPSRVSILTGQYSHTTGVYKNTTSTGAYGSGDFDDTSTLATWLRDLPNPSYKTAFIGKHLNGYRGYSAGSTYVQGVDPYDVLPPGWDYWAALVERRNQYISYALQVKEMDEPACGEWGCGRRESHRIGEVSGTTGKLVLNLTERYNADCTEPAGCTDADEPDNYSTDVFAAKAIEFIDAVETADRDRPYFVLLSLVAPHVSGHSQRLTVTPGEQYRKSFRGVPGWRPENYDEADISDKPAWLADEPLLADDLKVEIDRFRRRQYESLLSVDDAVKALYERVAYWGETQDTMFVFFSDNGLLYGEHRLTGKSVPYEESIAVPLAIRYDRLIEAARGRERDPITNIDLAPTIADLAGVPNWESLQASVGNGFSADNDLDGVTMRALLDEDIPVPLRTEFLIESSTGGRDKRGDITNDYIPPFCGIRTFNGHARPNFMYAVYDNTPAIGPHRDLYDMGDNAQNDPAADKRQLENRSRPGMGQPWANIRADLEDRLFAGPDPLCDPFPPRFER